MDVIQSKYLLLTTFTKDGRPKPTPIWGVPDGDKLLVITDDGSWKTKRINKTPRVTIAKSAALGKPKSEEVEAVARVLPKSETRRVYNAVLKRYWYHAPWFYVHSIVRGGIDKVHVGLEIKPRPRKLTLATAYRRSRPEGQVQLRWAASAEHIAGHTG